jgi:hypothetical protein
MELLFPHFQMKPQLVITWLLFIPFQQFLSVFPLPLNEERKKKNDQ